MIKARLRIKDLWEKTGLTGVSLDTDSRLDNLSWDLLDSMSRGQNLCSWRSDTAVALTTMESKSTFQANQSLESGGIGGEIQPLLLRSLSWKPLAVRLKTRNRFAIVGGFIGYMLSPFSPYNDIIVNIAPSYFLAVYTGKIIPVSVAVLTATYYGLSNLLGILLLWLSIRKLTNRVNALPSWWQAMLMAIWVAASVIFLSKIDPAQVVARIGLRLG